MDVPSATKAKIWRRIVPFFFLIYLINVLDRANVGFAALQMNHDLALTPAVFGFGAGVFFLGYVLVEIPSNLVLHRVGPRIWLARIMIMWGLITAATALTRGPISFSVFRFMLGVAEAGFVPGMLYGLTVWFPRREHAGVIAQVWIASAVAIVLGGPLSGALMQLDGWLGLAGWQWIFVVEGVPAVMAGFACLRYLTEKPADATWLTPDERQVLSDRAARDQAAAEGEPVESLGGTFANPRVWLLSALYFFMGIGFYGITFWLPQILKQMSGFSSTGVSLVAAVPFALAAVGMYLNARHSDRSGERRLHLAGALLLGAGGLAGSALAGNVFVSFGFFCAAVVGIWSAVGVFWSVPASFLRGRGAAGGLALINSIGGIGAFVGPYAIGVIRSWTPDFSFALFGMAGSVLVAAGLAALLRERSPLALPQVPVAPDNRQPIRAR